MYFYEVFVSSGHYHGAEALTYSSVSSLDIGSLVSVPFGKSTVAGFVSREVSEPGFKTKPIGKQLHKRPLASQQLKLHAWIMEYYPGPSGFITQLFLPSTLLTSSRTKPKEVTVPEAPKILPVLTGQQSEAINFIRKCKDTSYLLHGETGSGKTRVYIELTADALADNKSVIVSTPEIGLTPQLAKAFEDAFPGQVIVVHSTQTSAERKNNWLRIHESEHPLVVIGPRSSLFSPVSNLGLVVVDEAHDTAYKQEQAPYYQATRIAAKLASINNAKVIFGTATPLVQDYFTFKSKTLPIIRMEQPAIRTQTRLNAEVVDMTKREEFSRSAWLSDKLIIATERALKSKSQSLLFLNRRGTARLVLCSKCGWQSLCPHCDLPLTYHGDAHHLRCHTCGYTAPAPSNCPSCQSTEIAYKSVGTKTIVSEVERLFPQAHVLRFDTDTKKVNRLESHFQEIVGRNIDILVGTQLLSKGLDLPNLAFVGIVNADTGLSFPDYTAEEKTFQMVRQVVGRVGRGHQDAHIVVQTYHPHRNSLVAALDRNYGKFYEREIAERQLYHFPPFYHILKIRFDRASQASSRTAALNCLDILLKSGIRVEASGPAPAFIERVANKYRWQIVLKSKQRSELIRAIHLLPPNCSYDIDPSDLL